MSTPRRGGQQQHHGDERTGARAACRDSDGQVPPRPWAALEHAQAPVDPFPCMPPSTAASQRVRERSDERAHRRRPASRLRRLVLANAIYFKGTWARPFHPSRTLAAPFHLPDGRGATVRAPFMTTSVFKDQQVAVFHGFKALKLPYKNDGGGRGASQAAFYMLLLLPDGEALKISGLYDMVVSTPGFIRKHTPVDEVPVGRFMVPKFKFTFEFEASDDMKKLGVSRAFGGGDFSGMVSGETGSSSQECTTRPP